MHIFTPQVALATSFANPLTGTVSPKLIMSITLWITGFLCLLNIALALYFRQRSRKEVVTYYLACVFELLVFVFALLFFLDVIKQSQIPYPLPPRLPINRAEIAAALAIGLGLFPAAYWHRINLQELPGRIAADGKVLKNQAHSIHVRTGAPEEWMN